MGSAILRRASLPVLALALVTALLVAVPAPAHADADAGIEAAFVAAINHERATAGLGQLRTADDLVGVARSHSQVMASSTELHHQPDLGGSVGGWRKVGENVGRGPSADAIHRAFMASPGHERNVLDPDWTEVGVGVIVRDGRVWVTELFRLPAGEPATRPRPTGEDGAAPAQPPALDRLTATRARPEAAERRRPLRRSIGPA